MIQRPGILDQVRIAHEAVCHDCKRWHRISWTTPDELHAGIAQWYAKHGTHRFEFVLPRRQLPRLLARMETRLVRWFGYVPWWLEYAENADIKTAYASSAAYTITLTSLASSATLVAGQESTAVSNTTNLYQDYLIGGRVTVGTTPTTATVIEVWAYGSVNDTPTYPDVFDGTDSAETVTSTAIKQACLGLLRTMGVDSATSDRVYWFGPVSLAYVYGKIPKNHGLFVTHSTVAALNGTAGNHVLSHTGVYFTV